MSDEAKALELISISICKKDEDKGLFLETK